MVGSSLGKPARPLFVLIPLLASSAAFAEITNVQTANYTSGSFTVTWMTSMPAGDCVRYGLTACEERPGLGFAGDPFSLGSTPNLFCHDTLIRYQVPRAARVRLAIYSPMGRHVATLVDAVQPAGWQGCAWAARGQASGVYLVRLQIGDQEASARLLLIR